MEDWRSEIEELLQRIRNAMGQIIDGFFDFADDICHQCYEQLLEGDVEDIKEVCFDCSKGSNCVYYEYCGAINTAIAAILHNIRKLKELVR
jgi:hypothetical protein